MNAVEVVAGALRGTGLNLIGSCGIEVYDRRAPPGFQSGALMSTALGLIVVGSAGRELWENLRRVAEGDRELWDKAHPLDGYVGTLLDRADIALARARIGSRRFEPLLAEAPAQSLDFRALGEITGLGSMGPFGLVIHPIHGPWWAFRGAWLIDVEVTEPTAYPAPCSGCHAPCVGTAPPDGILHATALVRRRCVVGAESRYLEEQIAYHYDREAMLAKLRAR